MVAGHVRVWGNSGHFRVVGFRDYGLRIRVLTGAGLWVRFGFGFVVVGVEGLGFGCWELGFGSQGLTLRLGVWAFLGW